MDEETFFDLKYQRVSGSFGLYGFVFCGLSLLLLLLLQLLFIFLMDVN